MTVDVSYTGSPVLAALLWGSPQWIVPAALIAAVLSVMVLVSYLRSPLPPAWRALSAALKLAAIALIALCLCEPMRSGTRPRPQANLFPILVDDSASMQLRPGPRSPTRHQRIAALVDADNDWRTRLAQSFDVRTYGFAARLQSVDSFETLQADGAVSALAGSLTSLSQRFSGRPVAGVLLLTDGNLTDSPGDALDWSTLGFPVFPVLPPSEGQLRDARITDVSVRQTDFESAPTTVTVAAKAIGMDREKLIVQLTDAATGKVVQQQSLTANGEAFDEEVTFRFRPPASGVRFYTASVFREADRSVMESIDSDATAADSNSEATSTSAATPSSEATLVNNRRTVTVDRTAGPYRILYIAGRPNWEFKFLRRALQSDAEVQLVGLLRIATKEPKFSFRDKGVNDTNPLFAGLGADEEELAQQYDEPVILRLGVKESEELSDGFPETAEELFAYHGVILDDIESDFFSQDQMLMLRRFVSARGGGLLMLGGAESFGNRRFADTPLGELSPLYAPTADDPQVQGPFQMRLTREGLLQPWTRLRETQPQEQQRAAGMPKFLTVNPVGDVKPGASQLLTVETPGGDSAPALVAQRFGKGRTAAIPVGDLWRWSMRRDSGPADDAAQAWRQTLRWLVNDVPRRAEVRIDTPSDPTAAVTIVATARDHSYLPLDNAKVELNVTVPSGESFALTAQPRDAEPGSYTATYWARDPGGYRVDATITAADGSDVGSASTGWAAAADAAEFQELELNRELLQSIATQTGGQVIREDELDDFVTELPNRKVPVTESWIYPIWHRPWVMLAAMACLCAEWGLRRWRGLA